MTLSVVCTGKMRVYVDGYNQTAASVTSFLGQMLYSYIFKYSTANLIGIQCLSSTGDGAIIAQSDFGLISDSSWKVAVGITDPDWTTACFDDSQWLNSVVITNTSWPHVSNAKWITYPGGNPLNRWVHYRILMRKYRMRHMLIPPKLNE